MLCLYGIYFYARHFDIDFLLISCFAVYLLLVCGIIMYMFLTVKIIIFIIISCRFSADMPLIFRHVILVLICCLFSALFYICSLFATSLLFSMFLFFIVKDIIFYYFLQIFCLYAIAHKY